MQQLKAQFLVLNAAGLTAAAHSLKSSSANVGAMGLSALCRDLEALTRIEGASVDDSCEQLVGLVEAEFDRVEAALLALRIELGEAAAKSLASD